MTIDVDHMDCLTQVEKKDEPGCHFVLHAGPPTITQELPVMTVECKTGALVDVMFQGDTYPFRSFFEQFSIPGRYADACGNAVDARDVEARRKQAMPVFFVTPA